MCADTNSFLAFTTLINLLAHTHTCTTCTQRRTHAHTHPHTSSRTFVICLEARCRQWPRDSGSAAPVETASNRSCGSWMTWRRRWRGWRHSWLWQTSSATWTSPQTVAGQRWPGRTARRTASSTARRSPSSPCTSVSGQRARQWPWQWLCLCVYLVVNHAVGQSASVDLSVSLLMCIYSHWDRVREGEGEGEWERAKAVYKRKNISSCMLSTSMCASRHAHTQSPSLSHPINARARVCSSERGIIT